MHYHKIKILCLLTIFNTFAQEYGKPKTFFEKNIAVLGQSKPVYLFEKYICLPTRFIFRTLNNFDDQLADPSIQELGKEAQLAVGISEKKCIPIKKLNPNIVNGSAIAEPDAIYVNEQSFQRYNFGFKRCTMLHEAIHVKNRDSTMNFLIGGLTFLTLSSGLEKIIKKSRMVTRSKALQKSVIYVPSYLSTLYACKKFHYFGEQRADVEGYYASNCSSCVKEAIMLTKYNEEEKLAGYLDKNSSIKIAEDLEQQHKLCTFHQQI